MSTLLFFFYLAALEVGRLTAVSGPYALFSPGAAVVVAALLRLPSSRGRSWLAVAAAAGMSSGILHGDGVTTAVLFNTANLAAGVTATRVFRAAFGPQPAIRSVQDALMVMSAYGAASLAASVALAAGLLATNPSAVSLQLLHLHSLSQLVGLFTVMTPLLVGWATLRTAVRGRVLEMLGLLVATVGMTHIFWAVAGVPRPGLLAPVFVWAAFRFQLAGTLINLPFVAAALVNSMMNRGPWAASGGVPELLVGLWLHVLVASTFLVLSAGVLERRRDQALLRRVLDEVTDGIIVIGEDGLVKTMNRRAAAQFAVDAAGSAPLAAAALLGETWRQRESETGRQADVDVVARRCTGEEFPATVSLTHVASDDEHHVLAVVHDLSRQRQTERSLEISEAQWRAVLEALPEAILIHAPDGRYTGVHTPADGPLSLPADRFLGCTVWDILPADEAALVDAARERVRTTRVAETLEYQATLDGRSRWFHSHLVPLGTDRTLSVLRDITEQRTLQDQLRQAQRLEAIGRLAGGVAHDFNNLLTVIGGSTELVLDQLPARDPLRRTLEEVRQASDRAAALTQQLLAFGRRQVLREEVFVLPQVVQGCEQMLRRLIGEHIGLSCRVTTNAPPVRADRSQIEQVIINLAVNARDAMPTGGRLTIETGAVTITDGTSAAGFAPAAGAGEDILPGHFATLAVHDTGLGIPEDVVEHIFEPFFTTKGVGEGTGLGLATVYGIARQSGGFITVRSEVGRGTTFVLHLPAVVEAAPADAAGLPAPSIARGCETILLVEDEDGVRDIARRFLTSAGYRVLAAASGSDALALAESHADPLHLVVTDVVMPGMSGPQLATRLRERRPSLRVVFMSGYPNDALLAHDLPAENAMFLQKPFSRQTLTEALRTALES